MNEQNKVPKVSIVILNWDGKKDTAVCLESLKKITYPNYHIILVDNGSHDDSSTYFKKNYAYVSLITIKENIGFTGGNNVGMKEALKQNADYVLMLNNDTVVEPVFLNKLVEAAEEDKITGIFGPKILYYSKPYKIWSAGGNFIPFIGKARTIGINEEDGEQYDQKKEVAWVTGCAMFIRRSVLEKIGLLEEKYFSNYEDIDFCLTAKKKGFKILYVPKAIIYHKIAKDWGGLDSPLYIYYQVRNNLLFIKRNLLFPNNMFAYLFLYLVSIPRRNIYLLCKADFSKTTFFYLAIKDFLQGNFYKTTFNISRNKKRENKLNIGINIRFIQTTISGIGKYVLELVKGLAKVDTTNKYTLYEYGHTQVVKPAENKNITYVVPSFYSSSRTMRIFWEQFFFPWYLKKNRIDIFHGPSFMLPVINSCKSIITVHDLTFIRYPESFTISTKIYYWLFFKRSLKNANMIIADSEATKKDIIKYFNIHPRKIEIIYLGVDDKFKVIKNKSLIVNVRKKYKLPESFFLFTGVLSPRKNIEGALRAFSSLKTKHKFVVVGAKGWLYKSIFDIVEKLKINEKVIFTGYIDADDLHLVYNAAEALVFPSFYEGFGLPILEAMACGCPVITSNISSMPEVAGDAAILVNPRNIEQISVAMKTIVTNRAMKIQLIKKGLIQAKKFTWEKTAKETKALYERVANV